MAVSLECRVPLLSTSLIEYMYSLKPEVRFHNNELKGAMKKSYCNQLPEEIINREKKGFSIPVSAWAPSIIGSGVSTKEYILKNMFFIDV
jgi:asparagine synthase (glutamine-hydrolysing)